MAQAVIGALRVNLGIDSAQFDAGLKNAHKRLDGFDRALKSGALAVGTLAVAAAAAGAAVSIALTKTSLETIDAQSKLAARVGGSVSAIQTLEHAAGLAGVSQEQLAKSVEKLNERLGEAARKGSGPAAEALERLGIAADKLSAMDADERLATLADRMAELGYTTQQQADTLRQFGIRNAEIINLLQGGGEAIRSARTEIEALGIAVSDVDAKTIERANDAMSKIGTAMTGIGNQIAVRLAPLIEIVADEMVEFAKAGGGAGAVIDQAFSKAVLVVTTLNREIYNTRITIDELIAGIIESLDWAAKLGPRLISWATDGALTPEDVGYRDTVHSFGRLRDELEKPPSYEEWMEWYNSLRAKAQETSQAIIDAMDSAQSGAGGTVAAPQLTELDMDRMARLQEQREGELAYLRQSLLSEAEFERNSYAERMIALQEFLDQQMLTKQDYDALSERAHQEHEERMRDISQRSIDMELRARRDMANRVSSLFDTLSSALSSAGEENFRIAKALSLASAVVKGQEAIVSSYAQGAKFGGPALGAVYAGIAAAATAAQIAQIASAQPNSAGSTGGAPAAAAPPTGGAGQLEQSSTLYVEGINPDRLYSGVQVRELAERLYEYQKDGGTVVFSEQ